MVNGKKIRIPSYRLKAGDVLSPIKTERYKELSLNTNISWIEVDSKNFTATVKHFPTREEIDTNINENLIIEFYSR
jgi:small subunit ribosomal protein S4